MLKQPSDSAQGYLSNKDLEMSSDTSATVQDITPNVGTEQDCASDFRTSIQKPMSTVEETDVEYSSDFSESVTESFSSLKGQSKCIDGSKFAAESHKISVGEQSVLSGSDMEGSLIWCDVCEQDKKQAKAYKLCINCQQNLCKECCDFHRKLKVLQGHVLQDKETVLKSQVKTDSVDVCKEKCSKHKDRVIEYFCMSCDQIGCTICVMTEHNKCSSLHHIPDIVDGFTETKEYKEVNGILKDIATQLELNKAKYETNIQKKAFYSERAKCAINKHRNKINAMFDAFEEQINSELESIVIYDSELLKTIHHRQESLTIDLQSMISNLEFKEKTGQLCELFIAMKKAKGEMENLQDRTVKLDINNHVASYKFEASEDMNELKERIKQSGTLQLIHSSLEKAEVLREEIDIKADTDKVAGTISGICFLNEDKIVLTDLRNEAVKVLDSKKGVIETTFAMPSKPWDVAKIENDEVAVSLPNDKKIVLLTINQSGSTENKKEMLVNGSCRGIAYSRGKFFISFDKPESMIQILDKTGQVMNCLKEDQFGNKLFQKPWYLNLSQDGFTIYASDNANHQITSLTLDGKVMAIYKDKDLRKPVGVTVDEEGSVFVLGSSIYSSNIYQLSDNLIKVHVHTSIGEGINNPRSAVYDNRTQKLYVGMEFSDKMQVITMSSIQS